MAIDHPDATSSFPLIPSPQAPTPIHNCHGCGVCCLHIGLPPFHASEMTQVPDWALAELNAAHDRDDGNLGPCVWFDHQASTCKHHEIRPRACRDFEVGEEACQLLRTHYRIGS